MQLRKLKKKVLERGAFLNTDRRNIRTMISTWHTLTMSKTVYSVATYEHHNRFLLICHCFEASSL